MFDRLRKALRREQPAASELPSVSSTASAPLAVPGQTALSDWAQSHGLKFATSRDGSTIAAQGDVDGRPWRLEIGRTSRKYIRGHELRARADLGIDPDVLLLLLNRPLKEALERQAYALFTDDLRTQADPNLPEEMRLVAMHQETGWPELPGKFWDCWSLVADDPSHGPRWLDARLAGQLLGDGQADRTQVPFLLLLLRGKAYLRTEFPGDDDPQALQRAAGLFQSACSSALRSFRTPG